MAHLNERYSREIARYGIMNDKLIAEAQEGIKSPVAAVRDTAREVLICSCLRIVVKEAARYAPRYGVPADDLIGVGNEALVYAVGRYDPARKVKFATYAWKAVRHRMLAYLRKLKLKEQVHDVDLENLVSVEPDYGESRYQWLYKALSGLSPFDQAIVRYTFFDDFHPSDSDIAEKLGIGTQFLKEQRERILLKLRGR